MDRDGGNQTQVTADGVTSSPVAAPDGRSIVFERADAGLWQIEVDGQNPRAVKNTIGALRPAMTPDGKWILYGLQTTGIEKLWKVPADGGAAPTPMLDAVSYRPAVSPDGTLVAFYYQERPGSWDLLAVMPFDSDRPTHTFKVSPSFSSATVRWTADGKALLHNSAIGDRPMSGFSRSRAARRAKSHTSSIRTFWASIDLRMASTSSSPAASSIVTR